MKTTDQEGESASRPARSARGSTCAAARRKSEEWNRRYPLAGYAARRTSTGMMPPYKYRKAHPEADLTPEERMELARGLEATIGGPDED